MINVIDTEIKPNQKQQECIENIEGKYLVLAGPGTGKTFTIIQRLKKMINLKIDPSRILCLTFSDAAASEMKQRLDKELNTIESGVNIFTYHSFCNDIISQNPEAFELSESYKVISDTIQRQIMKECIDEINPIEYKNQKNNPYVYLKIILDKIKEIKRNRLSKEQYFENIEKNPSWMPKKLELQYELHELIENNSTNIKKIEKLKSEIEKVTSDINKAKEIWQFYELYLSKTQALSYIDFDDMICFVLEKFNESKAFLNEIAKKYDYIMVDEYQDTNDIQNAIVFNLASVCENIFVVGDDDQIIYSFQGANLDNIENYLKHFPDTKVICLNENMRSTQEILDVARSVSKQDTRRLEINPDFKKYNINKDLIAKNNDILKKSEKVRLTKYYNKQDEFIKIVDEIEDLINSPECPKDKSNEKKLSQIAIITTNNDELGEFYDLLKNRNIPVELKEGKSIYRINSFITLFYYLQMLVNPQIYGDKILKLLLMEPFKFNPLDISKIIQNLSLNDSIIDTIKNCGDWVDKEKIEKFITTYSELLNYQNSETIKNIVMETGAKTGIFRYFTENPINKNENILALKKIIEEADDFSKINNAVTLSDFIEYLLIVQDDDEVDIKISKPPVELNAIQLTTYHSSKGKEYEYVYMPSLQANRWESSSKSFKPTIPTPKETYKTDEQWKEYKISDRIKNMYVGMTRAKHTLRLSYVMGSAKRASSPSSWIIQAKDLMETYDLSDSTLENYIDESKKILEKKSYDYKRDFEEFIKASIKNKFHSPTSINTYLDCKRKYLYSKILSLGARDGFNDGAAYGSLIHAVFEYVNNYAIKNKIYIEKSKMLEKYEELSKKFPFSNKTIKNRYFIRGKNELEKYYHHILDISPENIFGVEYQVKVESDDIKFYGIIDKIEKNPDGTFSIIDYKTSNPLKEKSISLDGESWGYYNQICLYKYFFEKLTNSTVKDVSFVFLLDGSKVTLTPSACDCEMVLNNFKDAIKGIENLDFEPASNNCSADSCKYCEFRDFCSINVI